MDNWSGRFHNYAHPNVEQSKSRSATASRVKKCIADRMTNGTRGSRRIHVELLRRDTGQRAPGKIVQELSKTIPNGQVGVTTVGQVRQAGARLRVRQDITGSLHDVRLNTAGRVHAVYADGAESE